MSENSTPEPEDRPRGGRPDRRSDGPRSGGRPQSGGRGYGSRPGRDGSGSRGGSRDGGPQRPRRDGDSRSGDSRGPRRDGDSRSGDSRGPRRDGDSRSGDFRGPRRDGDSRTGGFRGPRRDDDSRGGFRGPRRDDDSRSGGFRGPRRDEEFRGDSRGPRRDDGFRDRDGGDRRPPRDEEYVPRPGTARAADEPDTPTDFDSALLPAGVRAELKGLPKDLADIVGAHILAAGELVDTDPELAFKHAEAARRRAGRIPIVREAAAETAYAAGHYDVALREYRAIRRMNGGDEFLPVMADCERALGRPRDALELLASLDPRTKNIGLQIECLLVEAGVRDDLGQRGEAMRLLKAAISHKVGPRLAQARLRYAYAEFLLEEGQAQEARRWFEATEKLDGEGVLDVTDRIAEIDGIVLPDDFEIESDEDEQPQPVADDAIPAPVKADEAAEPTAGSASAAEEEPQQ